MNKLLKNKAFLTVCRIIVAVVFITAGAEKINDPASFATAISNYRILPTFALNIFAIILPWIEIFAGTLLLFGVFVRENVSILNALLLLFTFMVLLAVLRGLNIECGCFGAHGAERVGVLKIIENTFVLILGFNVHHNYLDLKNEK